MIEILVVGIPRSGKTSFVNKLVTRIFINQYVKKDTIDIYDFYLQSVKIRLYDCPGDINMIPEVRKYYPRITSIIHIYNDNVDDFWLKEISKNCNVGTDIFSIKNVFGRLPKDDEYSFMYDNYEKLTEPIRRIIFSDRYYDIDIPSIEDQKQVKKCILF